MQTDQSPFAGDAAGFETDQCGTSSPVKRGALGEPLSFKMTMNARQTSATFSTASLLYYHFSRYLDAAVHVPVSVYRSMDRAAHAARVTEPGVRLSKERRGGAMNHAGWTVMQRALREPSSYPAPDELFIPDRTQVYGGLFDLPAALEGFELELPLMVTEWGTVSGTAVGKSARRRDRRGPGKSSAKPQAAPGDATRRVTGANGLLDAGADRDHAA